MDSLTHTSTLWKLFFATIALTLAFEAVTRMWNITLIDSLSDPDVVRAHVAGMTNMQRQIHIWTTATLDVAYPFAYGFFFIGMALRFFGERRRYLAIPGMLVIPVDLAEGVVQVMVLSGNSSIAGAKMLLTPWKFGLFAAAAVVALAALVIAIYQHYRPADD